MAHYHDRCRREKGEYQRAHPPTHVGEMVCPALILGGFVLACHALAYLLTHAAQFAMGSAEQSEANP
jgi:hypothetical protein